MLSKLQFLRRKKKTILISLEMSTLTNGDIIKITSRSSWLEKGGGLVQTFKRKSDRGEVCLNGVKVANVKVSLR